MWIAYLKEEIEEYKDYPIMICDNIQINIVCFTVYSMICKQYSAKLF